MSKRKDSPLTKLKNFSKCKKSSIAEIFNTPKEGRFQNIQITSLKHPIKVQTVMQANDHLD